MVHLMMVQISNLPKVMGSTNSISKIRVLTNTTMIRPGMKGRFELRMDFIRMNMLIKCMKVIRDCR